MRKKIVNNKDIVELVVEYNAQSVPGQSIQGLGAFLNGLNKLLRMWLSEEALTELIDGLHEDDPYTRICIIRALGCLGPGRAVPALIHSLKDKDEEVRNIAKVCLRWVCRGEPSAEALIALKSGMSDPDMSIRQTIIQALGELKSNSMFNFIPELISSLQSEDKLIRNAAVSSLESITGNRFFISRKNPQKWSDWWTNNKAKFAGDAIAG